MEDQSAFDQELSYFIRTVVPPRFKQAFSQETLLETIKKQVIWEDRHQRGQQNRAKREGKAASAASAEAYETGMEGRAFERVVADIFKQQGFDVRFTPPTGDQGVDLLVQCEGVLIAVQCKRSAAAVGNAAVQEIAAGRLHYGAKAAWVVSDAPFTPGARQLAQTNNVKLVPFGSLREAASEALRTS